MRTRRFGKNISGAVCLLLLSSVLMLPSVSSAKTAQAIDASVNGALDRFMIQVRGSKEFLRDAKGVLVLADVYLAGFGVGGGEYGEFNQPIVGFVVGQQGLMYNLTLEGAKISKMPR